MINKFFAILVKAIEFIKKPIVARITLIILGTTSVIWFLIRVIPKPQRATYPCMRASAPVMSAFVIYLITLFSSISAFKVARKFFEKARYVYAILFFGIAAFCTSLFFFGNTERVYAQTVNSLTVETNKPIGVAKGIFPGRVAWAHNPKAANWDGVTGFWWDDKYNPQNEVNKLLTNTLTTLTGQKSEANAWKAIFKYFNKNRNRGDKGYQQNEKIAIKINQNNTYGHADNNEINTSPQLLFALLNSLVNQAGVPQKNITVFDASRFITDNIFDKCHPAFPDIQYLDNIGGNGRIKSSYIENGIPYSSDNGKLAKGLATCAIDADYLINMAILKGHVKSGVTLCAKNYYGATNIVSNWKLNNHSNNFNPDPNGNPRYMTFVDYLGHKDLGNKTVLFLIDALYGCKLVNGVPTFKWSMNPFNNSWPCSLFASQDPVAIDAVGIDFFTNEFPDARDLKNCDQYLKEAAMANNPPSRTHYDPENDGSGLQSLGVFEHWNNALDKKYSRNLKTGNGIELIYKKIQ